MRSRTTRVLQVILFASKVYIVAVPLVIWSSSIIASLAGWHPGSAPGVRYVLREQYHRELALYCGYAVPLLVFCVAAMTSRERTTSRSSAIFALVTAIVLAFALGAKLFPPKTRGWNTSSHSDGMPVAVEFIPRWDVPENEFVA